MYAMYSQEEVLLHYNFINSRGGRLSSTNIAINTGDFSNHNSSPTIALTHQDSEYVYWTTTRALLPGTEFTSDYGVTSTLRAFLAYGFVIEDPSYDVVGVAIEGPSSSFSGTVIETETGSVTALLSFLTKSRVNVMEALRRLVADPSELWMVLEHPPATAPVGAGDVGESRKKIWVSRHLEKKMLLRLAKACKHHLNE